MKRLISTGLWVAALGAVPAVSPAADTAFDGKWTANLKCSQHLENGRPAFARQFELTVSAGRISEALTQGTGSGKEDTQWEGRVDAGVLSLNGPTQRADGARWSLNFTGKANGKDRIAASGGLSSDQRKLRDCTLDLQLASPAPAAATAPLAAAPRPAVAAVAATVVAVAPASPTMVATAPTAPARAAAPAAAPTPSPSPPTNPSATTTAPTSTPRADLTPLEARVEAIAGNKLLDIVVVVATDKGRERIRRGVSGDWSLNADSLCIDSAMFFKSDGMSLPMRAFAELGLSPKDSTAVRPFTLYQMLRHEPARDESGRANAGRGFGGPTPMVSAGIPSRSSAPKEPSASDDMKAVLAHALERGFQKRFGKAVGVGLDTGGGCHADATIVPRAVLDASIGASLTSTWRAGVERGTVVELFTVSVADYRAARKSRANAIEQWDQNMAALVDRLAKSPASGEQALYGAISVGGSSIRACYVNDSASAPRHGVSLEAVLRSAEFKNFLPGSISSRTRFETIDALYADLQKSQGRCTTLIGNGPSLAQLKTAIDRDKQLNGRLMPEPLSEARLLASHAEGLGFKTPEAYLFGRSIDVAEAMQVSRLQTLGINTKEQFFTARKRLEQFDAASKPDVDALLQFLADEREATAGGKTVKVLRAERAKREDEEARRYMAALAAEEKKKAGEFPFVGLLSCSISGQKTSVQACLSSGSIQTEVELRNGDDYRMYKIHDIAQIGNWDGTDMRIDLRKNFELKAQNADKSLILTLVVKDRASGKVLFQKSAAQFGVVNVKG